MLDPSREAVAFEPQEIMELEEIVTDQDEKAAYLFLKERVYKKSPPPRQCVWSTSVWDGGRHVRRRATDDCYKRRGGRAAARGRRAPVPAGPFSAALDCPGDGRGVWSGQDLSGHSRMPSTSASIDTSPSRLPSACCG